MSQHNRFEIHPFIQSWINERFYKAVREGDLESVKFCIQNGFNLEAKNNLGETPLFDLCHSGGNLEMVKILLQKMRRKMLDGVLCTLLLILEILKLSISYFKMEPTLTPIWKNFSFFLGSGGILNTIISFLLLTFLSMGLVMTS